MGLRQTLRFVNHDQQQIPRLVGWQYGSKTGQDFGLGVAPADYLVRSAGFAAHKVAWNIGPCRRAFFHIEAHQVAHFLGGFGLYHAFGELLASAWSRLRKVGGIIVPPLTSAEIPITACNGATESPCPKAIVTVLSSPQCLGTNGSALSGNSVRNRSS